MTQALLSEDARAALEKLLATEGTHILQEVVNLLQGEVDHYDWVGFYLVDPSRSQQLVLGPYAGDATEHDSIPFGQGVCGQAATAGRTIVVDDVRAEGNYLACSLQVKSEIVIPVYHEGLLIAELDLDSWQLAAFTQRDRDLLEELALRLASKLAAYRSSLK